MSHDVEKMVFTGKKPWWYGNSWQGDAVGVDLGSGPITSREAILAAGLDWDVQAVPAAFRHPVTGEWMESEGDRFLLRDSDMSVLGRCSEQYVPFQNLQAFDFTDSLVKDGAMLYHTAGSLKGGKQVWILAQLPGRFEINRMSGAVNSHYKFLLMMIGHDGKTGIRLMPTDVRAECANTCGWAERKAERKEESFTIAHTANATDKLKLAAAAIAGMDQTAVARQAVLQALADRKMETEEFIDFATSIFLGIDNPDPSEVERLVAKWYEDATPRSKTIMENQVAEVTKRFREGIGNEGDSAYDALQAFTEHYDHAKLKESISSKVDAGKRAADRVRKMENAVNSAWLGAGAKRKALVYKRLTGK